MDPRRIGDGIKGMLAGVVFGAGGGLGVCVWLIDGNLLFPGDTMLVGAAVCGFLGYAMGDAFFEWVWEHWLNRWRW